VIYTFLILIVHFLVIIKIKIKNEIKNKNALFLFSEDPTPRNDSIRLDPGSLVTSSGTFYVAVGCACVMIVVVIAVTSVVYVKSKKARTQESLQ